MTLVLVWTSVPPWNYAAAAETAPSSTAPAARKQSSAADFASGRAEEALYLVKATLQELSRDIATGRDIAPRLDVLKNHRESIAAADPQVRAEFSQTEKTIRDAKLPDVVLKRHEQTLADYDNGMRPVVAELDEVERLSKEHNQAVAKQDQAGAKTKYENLKSQVGKTKALVEGKVKDKPHVRHDPNRMPFRPAEAKDRKPRLKKDEFREFQATQRVAAIGPLSGLLLAQVTDPPTPEDSAETIDVQFTPGIRQLADQLGRDPVKIYYFVRNKIRFVPTYGSIQGAEACRLSMECNAFDEASLLIALLRVSGVPARYVPGTIELTPDFFRSAMGDFQDLSAAGRLAASGGIPTVVVRDAAGGAVGVRMEHVWVEAFLNYVPSRGALGGTADTWVPLDAALKRMRFRAPIDVATAAGVDPMLLMDELAATATVGADGSATGVSSEIATNRIQQFQQATLDNINQNHSTATVGDILGALEIQPMVASSVLPNSLPGRVLTVGNRVSVLPAESHHKVTIRLLDRFGLQEQLSVQSTTAELAGKRITLSYVAATSDDVATIKAFGGLLKVPPYLVRFTPAISLDGNVVQTAPAVSMGTGQILQVTFEEPDGARDAVEHHVSAGTYAVVGLDLQSVSEAAINQSKAGLESVRAQLSNPDATIRFDDLMGGMLQVHAQGYFLRTEGYNRMLGNRMNVVSIKRPAEMLATFAPVFATLFDTPVRVVNTGMNVDVRRYVVSASSRSGLRDVEVGYLLSSGSNSSLAENNIFEELHGTRSVSAVRLIAEANNRGIPIYRIDSSNQSQLIPKLNVSAQVLADVQNAVAAGKRVLIPRDQMTFLSWQGVGYIVTDLNTGAGAYLISGGLAGGGTAEQSDFLETLAHLFEFGGYLFDLGVIGLAAIGLASALLVLLGHILTALFVLATVWYVWNKTGDVWATLAAGLVATIAALYVSVVANAIAWTLLLPLASAVLPSILFYLVVAVIATLVVALIVHLLTTAAARIRQRYYARQRNSDVETVLLGPPMLECFA